MIRLIQLHKAIMSSFTDYQPALSIILVVCASILYPFLTSFASHYDFHRNDLFPERTSISAFDASWMTFRRHHDTVCQGSPRRLLELAQAAPSWPEPALPLPALHAPAATPHTLSSCPAAHPPTHVSSPTPFSDSPKRPLRRAKTRADMRASLRLL